MRLMILCFRADLRGTSMLVSPGWKGTPVANPTHPVNSMTPQD
jgi:hypothetical protein